MYLAVEKHKIIVKYCQFKYNYHWCCKIDTEYEETTDMVLGDKTFGVVLYVLIHTFKRVFQCLAV
jgi:hypothetical protein